MQALWKPSPPGVSRCDRKKMASNHRMSQGNPSSSPLAKGLSCREYIQGGPLLRREET